jgi:hypothetical protein
MATRELEVVAERIAGAEKAIAEMARLTSIVFVVNGACRRAQFRNCEHIRARSASLSNGAKEVIVT